VRHYIYISDWVLDFDRRNLAPFHSFRMPNTLKSVSTSLRLRREARLCFDNTISLMAFVPGNRGLFSDQQLTPQEKVNQEWDGMAGEWDDLAKEYASGFYNLIWNKTGIDPSKKPIVVDFGCGTGLLAHKMSLDCTKIVALDASAKMIDILQDKVRDFELQNVEAECVMLANIKNEARGKKTRFEGLAETVDLIVASSVFTFVPEGDIEATMHELGKMLKVGGILCHSDWPKTAARHPNAMSEEKARQLHKMARLETQSTEICVFAGSEVFVGIAKKSQ
jgi:2-polyprenyl-3-methyl-5-hydroxy-6-metoxy-1,4-benzoquinol methylase